jgi:hypothetical protein
MLSLIRDHLPFDREGAGFGLPPLLCGLGGVESARSKAVSRLCSISFAEKSEDCGVAEEVIEQQPFPKRVGK